MSNQNINPQSDGEDDKNEKFKKEDESKHTEEKIENETILFSYKLILRSVINIFDLFLISIYISFLVAISYFIHECYRKPLRSNLFSLSIVNIY